MAVRLVYRAMAAFPYVEDIPTEFKYFPGFSLQQKQRSFLSLREAFLKTYGNSKVLEISSKSDTEPGNRLSAFNLQLRQVGQQCSVECAFQGSKVFDQGGPYTDLLVKSSYEAKKDQRLTTSGALHGFCFNEEKFPLEPIDYFYSWLYMQAVHQQPALEQELLAHNAFTDIEFNPKRSLNCQAKAAARMSGAAAAGVLQEALESTASFLRVLYGEEVKDGQLSLEF